MTDSFWEQYKKWQEDVNKVYVHSSRSPNPEIEELLTANYLLERAYAHDPLVMSWLDTHRHTTEDLEAEIDRLRRALARRRVEARIIDVLKMREDIAEKERHLTPLLELELILEGAQKMERWAEERMREKGFATVEELEAEVNRLRGIVLDPQEIEPLILRDHTRENIIRVADYVQTEGSIGFVHHPKSRVWCPFVSVGMGVEEPIELVSKLVTVPKSKNYEYRWYVAWGKAFSLLKTIEPYLMADKWESARYLLNMGKVIPDTEYRPMYVAIVEGVRKVVFLYPEYVDFPTKYSIVVHKGEVLPRPFRRIYPIKYTLDGRAILWHEGIVKDP